MWSAVNGVRYRLVSFTPSPLPPRTPSLSSMLWPLLSLAEKEMGPPLPREKPLKHNNMLFLTLLLFRLHFSAAPLSASFTGDN